MSGPSLNQNVKVYRANSASLVIAVVQADGTPYDPTLGAEVFYRMARTSYSPESEALVKKSLGNGITNETGGLTVVINPEDSDFDPGIYYHELRIWDSGDVSTAMVGAFIIKAGLPMGHDAYPSAAQISLSATVPTRTP